MPLLDMPLHKLKEYRGISPKPADFDDFWDEQLKKLENIDPQIELTRVDYKSFFADAYEMRFTSTQGARIFAKMLKPKNVAGKMPAVIFFHGLGGCGASFNEMLAYASQGYCVFTMDSRGQGGKSEDVGGTVGTTQVTMFMRGVDGPAEKMYGVNLFLDTAMIAKIVSEMEFVDESRIGVQGGSQGGALSVACAALFPSVKLCAPTVPYMSDYKRVWEMDLAQHAYDGMRDYFRRQDPRHEREAEVFEKLGYIDIQNLAPRIKAKLLMGTGLMDNICPPSTQFAMYNKLTCEKDLVIYPDYGHETPGSHGELVFNFMSQL